MATTAEPKRKGSIKGATYYDWPTTLDMVRKMEPNVIFFSDAGPGVRWVGNERGVAGETNWNTITTDTLYAGKPNIEKLLNTGSPDGTKWVPAEVDVSIRPGWFYHAKEDKEVKTPEQLLRYLPHLSWPRLYPAAQRTARSSRPVPRERCQITVWLCSFGKAKVLKNLAVKAPVKADSYRGNQAAFAARNLTDGNKETYWTTNDDITTGQFEVTLPANSTVSYIVLQEYIKLGQRVQSFTVEALAGWSVEKNNRRHHHRL